MIAFWVLAAILIASAVWTIAAKKPVYSVVALLLNFATLAVLYVTLSAEFLAVIQIIVYSGAILVLFVFVIALLGSGVAPFRDRPEPLAEDLAPRRSLHAGGVRIPRSTRFPASNWLRRQRPARSARPTFSAASPTSARRSLPCSSFPLK